MMEEVDIAIVSALCSVVGEEKRESGEDKRGSFTSKPWRGG